MPCSPDYQLLTHGIPKYQQNARHNSRESNPAPSRQSYVFPGSLTQKGTGHCRDPRRDSVPGLASGVAGCQHQDGAAEAHRPGSWRWADLAEHSQSFRERWQPDRNASAPLARAQAGQQHKGPEKLASFPSSASSMSQVTAFSGLNT